MSDNNNGLPVKQIEFDVTTLPAQTKDLSNAQIGWLGMEFSKRQTIADLTRSELEIQTLITQAKALKATGEIPAMNDTLTKIKGIIDEAKKKWNTAQGQRKYYTGFLTEKVIEPMMLYEKRSDLLIKEADAHELEQRKFVVAETNKTQGLVNEKAAYKAHIENENLRIKELYKEALQKQIDGAYLILLGDKEPVEKLPIFKKNLIELLKGVKLQPATKYTRILVSDTDAKAIISTITMYDSGPDLTEAINSIDDRFLLYGEDLANAEAATNRVKMEGAAREQEVQNTITQEAAINTMTAKAGTFTFEGGAKLKKKQEVVIENTEACALAIMGNFIRMFNDVRKFVSVKEWEKLTIKQMATALGKWASETGEGFNGLELKEVTK